MNMDAHLAQSKQRYEQGLGKCMTDGKQIVHFTPLTKKFYDFDWDERMRNMNPKLYDKYLKHYGEMNE
jgi:hypothetical protein